MGLNKYCATSILCYWLEMEIIDKKSKKSITLNAIDNNDLFELYSAHN